MNFDDAPQGFTGGDLRFLSFSLGSEEYGIPLLMVREVIALPEITEIPFAPSYYLGVMNLRGQIISVIDLRAKLGIKPLAESESAVIICDIAPLCLGFVADSINAVLVPGQDEVSAKPDVPNGRNTDYIVGAFRQEERMTMLIDIAKALGVDDIQALANSKKHAA